MTIYSVLSSPSRNNARLSTTSTAPHHEPRHSKRCSAALFCHSRYSATSGIRKPWHHPQKEIMTGNARAHRYARHARHHQHADAVGHYVAGLIERAQKEGVPLCSYQRMRISTGKGYARTTPRDRGECGLE